MFNVFKCICLYFKVFVFKIVYNYIFFNVFVQEGVFILIFLFLRRIKSVCPESLMKNEWLSVKSRASWELQRENTCPLRWPLTAPGRSPHTSLFKTVSFTVFITFLLLFCLWSLMCMFCRGYEHESHHRPAYLLHCTDVSGQCSLHCP